MAVATARNSIAQVLTYRGTAPILRLYTEVELFAEGDLRGYPLAWKYCVTCNGTGWLCACSGGPSDQCPQGDCPSMDGCPTCLTGGSAKALVRDLAGHRCVRCLHPYVCGESDPEWSPCDERCQHHGPIRWRDAGKTGWLSEEHTPRAGVGVGRGWEVQAKRRVLTVHHLLSAHHQKRNLRWWNLTALCQRCHLTIQGKVKMHRAWPWEHSDWFKPYVAGFYAWKYGGVDLSRPEVEAELEELLKLGQVEESRERMPV